MTPPAPLGETTPVAAIPVPLVPDDEEPLAPLPTVEEAAEALELDVAPARVDLGRQLFHDTRLSNDMTVSCATCHDLRFGGADRSPRAVGIHGQVGPLNTPTVFNAALGIAQFWDGRAKDLAAQASGPPQAAGEMGSNFTEITARLRNDAMVVESFRRAFPNEVNGPADVTTERILEAIATFEVTLLTPGSRFDRWLGGESAVLTEPELRGYATFKQVGCVQCHYGPAVGGKTFQKLGQKKDFFSDRHLSHADHGRFNVTKDERDRHAFKVPSLRNVELTAPYLHDGSVPSLAEAVRVMGTYQLGVDLTSQQVDDLVAFLRTLTGTWADRPLAAPMR
ncbi:MAG: c-type cytochrome [Planctomycetes bacterium]|nr:c-type cytochrome [Planctomycetota bacterium]